MLALRGNAVTTQNVKFSPMASQRNVFVLRFAQRRKTQFVVIMGKLTRMSVNLELLHVKPNSQLVLLLKGNVVCFLQLFSIFSL